MGYTGVSMSNLIIITAKQGYFFSLKIEKREMRICKPRTTRAYCPGDEIEPRRIKVVDSHVRDSHARGPREFFINTITLKKIGE